MSTGTSQLVTFPLEPTVETASERIFHNFGFGIQDRVTVTDIFFHQVRIIENIGLEPDPVRGHFSDQVDLLSNNPGPAGDQRIQKRLPGSSALSNGHDSAKVPNPMAIAAAGNGLAEIERQQGTFHVPTVQIKPINRLDPVNAFKDAISAPLWKLWIEYTGVDCTIRVWNDDHTVVITGMADDILHCQGNRTHLVSSQMGLDLLSEESLQAPDVIKINQHVGAFPGCHFDTRNA